MEPKEALIKMSNFKPKLTRLLLEKTNLTKETINALKLDANPGAKGGLNFMLDSKVASKISEEIWDELDKIWSES